MRTVINVRLFAQRLAAIPQHAGDWGKALTCIMAFGWMMALITNDPSVERSPAMGPAIAAFGRVPVAAWMGIIAFLPLIGAGLGLLWLRTISATMCLATWLGLVGAAVAQGGFGSAAVWIYFAAVVACSYAHYRVE
jgi:hypothetical protein